MDEDSGFGIYSTVRCLRVAQGLGRWVRQGGLAGGSPGHSPRGPKRFLHSEGSKNVLCLFTGSIQNIAPAFLQCFVLTMKKRQSTFLGPSE